MSGSSMACKITRVPSEITELSLIYSYPKDVAAFSQTCRAFYNLVYTSADSHLWRRLWFAQGFDDPRMADRGIAPLTAVDWKVELQRRVKAELIISGGFARASSRDRVETLQTLVHAVATVLPYSEDGLPSFNLLWVRRLIRDAHLQDRPVVKLPNDNRLLTATTVYDAHVANEMEETLHRHHLHAYLGLSDYEKSDQVKSQRRTEARCFAYDLRNYTEKNHWGPLLPGQTGKINWMHADHLLEVVTRNLDDHGPAWEPNRPPVGLESVRPYSAPGVRSRKSLDWAGVEGKWRRIVCFMDYRDLYEYNFASGMNGPRDPSVFHQPEFEEATRFIYLELHITGFSPTYSANAMPLRTGDIRSISDLGPRPTIHFSGSSKGGSGNEASVKGLVRITKDNNIRWSFVSIFDSQLQWSSEGVQIGGAGSAMGVIGTWTGAQHDEADPAGNENSNNSDDEFFHTQCVSSRAFLAMEVRAP